VGYVSSLEGNACGIFPRRHSKGLTVLYSFLLVPEKKSGALQETQQNLRIALLLSTA